MGRNGTVVNRIKKVGTGFKIGKIEHYMFCRSGGTGVKMGEVGTGG